MTLKGCTRHCSQDSPKVHDVPRPDMQIWQKKHDVHVCSRLLVCESTPSCSLGTRSAFSSLAPPPQSNEASWAEGGGLQERVSHWASSTGFTISVLGGRSPRSSRHVQNAQMMSGQAASGEQSAPDRICVHPSLILGTQPCCRKTCVTLPLTAGGLRQEMYARSVCLEAQPRLAISSGHGA